MATTLPASPSLAARLRPILARRVGIAIGLWGAPGIGKTHTVGRLLGELPCHTFSVHATLPLPRLLELLPRPAKLSLWATRGLERLAAGEGLGPDRTAEILSALLAALAPVVLHVEDTHEAPPARLQLLGELARYVPRCKGVGLLATSRTTPPEGFEAVLLGALPPEASSCLLEAEVGTALPSEAIAWIHERAQGNPLFTLEYFRFLARQGNLWNDTRRWRWRPPERASMPVTVEALVETVLAASAADGLLETALQARALVPQATDRDLWQQVAGLSAEETARAERELAKAGILREGEFAHPLYREVCLGNLPAATRRSLARRALAALEHDPVAAADFADDAGLAPAEALTLLLRAADRARQERNDARAGRLLARAVDHASGKDRGRIAFEAGSLLQSVDQPKALALFRIAVEADPEDPEARFQLAGCHAVAGDAAAVERVLAGLPDREAAQLEWTRRLIHLRFGLSDYRGVLELWQASPELRIEPDPELAYVVGFALVLGGNLEEAEGIALEALRSEGRSDLVNARLLSVCGLANLYRERLELARRFLDDAVAAARRSGRTAFIASALHNRSILLERTNEIGALLADVDETLRLYAEAGTARYYASTLSKLGRILHEQGCWEQAEETLLESRQTLEKSDPSHFLITCDAHLSSLYCDWDRPHTPVLAAKYAHSALTTSQRLGESKIEFALCYASFAETHQGRAQRGLELAEQVLGRIRPDDLQSLYCGRWARGVALARLGREAEAREDLKSALDLAFAHDWHVYAHKIGLELDRLDGDLASARRRLRWFEGQGFGNGAALARRIFPGLDAEEDPVPEEPIAPDATLRVLGPLELERGGKTEPVRGSRRQELLALLLEARIVGRPERTRLDLCDRLYPDKSEDEAQTALKQLVFQARAALGQTVIATTASGYRLGELASDAEAFLRGGETRLWRGPYLGGAAAFDETVREALYQALRNGLEATLASDPLEAARIGRILVAAEPYDLDLLRWTLVAHRDSGDTPGLASLYAESRLRFAEVGADLPAAWSELLEAPGAPPPG